ncbi:uncharacterized protein LOC143292287 [Babylonia areolata]|uniref:uncharacterized protein LOC143292287 n=1 Tax=Babylonia areolata TaxID=304850 RepID=UPI003FD5CCE5
MGFIPWDNPENIISQETEKVVDTVVGAICLPVLFLISVPCNLLNMLVFWMQGLKERINLCLFYLSFVDFVHMLNSFLFNFERIRLPFSITVEFGPVMEFIVDHGLIGFVRGFTWISGCVSMLIASERCLCVVSPLRSQTFLKTTTTAAVLSLATVLILTGSLMIGLRWSLICVWDTATNTTSIVIYTSTFFRQYEAHLDVLTFFLTTLQLFFYVTVVTATTIVTSVKLKKMAAWRKQTSSSTLSSREVALTRMLIAVSILYVICSVPSIATGAAGQASTAHKVQDSLPYRWMFMMQAL